MFQMWCQRKWSQIDL